MANQDYDLPIRKQIRDFLVREYEWRLMQTGCHLDLFANYRREVVAIIEYHKEQKCSVYIICDNEFSKVVNSVPFTDIASFQNLIIDYL